ncbi:MAG: hypothetical protein HFG18_03330 [Oscillospiraceae bacterium]|nr:hypothetical protein [Oscillospiraceae bacterium]
MKFNFSKLLDNKRFLMIFSLALSAVAWMLIVTYISTIESNTISNVPVDFEIGQEEYLVPKNLKVITKEDLKVRVEVRADRKILSALKQDPESLSIYADLSEIPQKGTYEVPLRANIASARGVTILSITPSTATLRVDQQTTKTFTIVPEIRGLSVPENYVAQSTRITPKTIDITGPDTDIQSIDRCVAEVNYTEPLTKTDTRRCKIKLYRADGSEISTESLILETDSIDVIVPVYKQKQLKVTFDFTGYPQGFPLDQFHYTFSTDTITVAGLESVVDKMSDELSIGYVALNEIDEGRILTFEVSLPNGVEAVDAPETITVSFDLEEIASANFTIPDTNIFLKNVPVNFDASLMTKSINNVRFLGDKDILETLTAQDIVAEIDLSNKELATGPYNLPVTISAPGKGFVWAVNNSNGAYMAVVSIQEKNS